MSSKLLKSNKDEAVFTIEIDATEFENEIIAEFRKLPPEKMPKNQGLPLSDKAMLAQHPELGRLAEQALNNLLPNYYMKAIKKFGLTPLTYPKINPKETKVGQPCVVEIRVALEPKVTLQQFEGIAAAYTPVIVTEEDVKQQIAGLRRQRGSGTDDEKLLETLPFETMDEFLAEIRGSLQSLADEKTEFNKRHAVIKKLIESNPCPLREEVVEQQIMLMINQFRQQVGAQNFDDYLKSKGQALNDMKKGVRPEAEEAVRKNLLLAAVADAISPEITEEDIKKVLSKQSSSILDMSLSYEDRRKKLESMPGALEQMQHAIRLNKAADHVVSKAVLQQNEPLRLLDPLPEQVS